MDNEIKKNFQLGGGPGLEFKIWRISLNWMAGIMTKTNLDNLQEFKFSTDVGAYYTF
jgi:hypothetical protein